MKKSCDLNPRRQRGGGLQGCTGLQDQHFAEKRNFLERSFSTERAGLSEHEKRLKQIDFHFQNPREAPHTSSLQDLDLFTMLSSNFNPCSLL